MGGSGYPTLAPITLYRVDPTTGASTSEGLTLSQDEELVWNFTGAQDPLRSRHYYAGGRANHATIPSTIVTVDTATPQLVSSVPLDPPVNLLHLEVEHSTGSLYGLAVGPGSLIFTGGHHYFAGAIDLVSIAPDTGVVTSIATNLPGELDHFAATLDKVGRRYLYHTFAGELHFVNLDTGALATLAVPEHLIDLQFDDATGALYGLQTCCSGTFEMSGTEGYRSFGEIDLVEIDTSTGAVTVLATGLPTGTTNWISGFQCELGHYLYVSDTGETHILDVTTGMLLSTSPHPPDSRFHSLD
jgi:hypothetical protein